MVRTLRWGGAALLSALLMASASGAIAQESSAHQTNTGPYVGIRAIGAVAFTDDVQTKNFTGTPLIENDEDGVAGPAIVAGYAFKPFPARVEVEAGYRVRFDLDVRDIAPGGTIDYENNLSTIQVLVNFVLQWRNSSAWTPFAGGTVGWARNRVDTQRTNLATQAQVNREENSDSLAYGLIAGIEWQFAQNWSAEAAYRFVDLGEIRTVNFAAGDQIESDDYITHDLLLTLNYQF